MKTVMILALLLVPALYAQTPRRPTPEQRLFEWTDLQFSKGVYQRRRGKMLARLRQSGGGVLIVPARYGVSDGFTFRSRTTSSTSLGSSYQTPCSYSTPTLRRWSSSARSETRATRTHRG